MSSCPEENWERAFGKKDRTENDVKQIQQQAISEQTTKDAEWQKNKTS